MRPVLEAPIEAEVCRKARFEMGVMNIKMKTSTNGWPDRMFFIPGGKPFMIEFKRPGDDPRALQVWLHELLTKLKYDVEVHDNVRDALQAIAHRMGTTPRPEEGHEISPRKRVRRPRG